MASESDLTGPGSPRWGFVGAGKMASALVRGMIRAGAAPASRIATFDPVGLAAEELGALGVSVLASNVELARSCRVLVLAVKPQATPAVLGELRPAITADHLVISIVAGVPLATLASGLGPEPRLARVMPNTPALVGEGAAGFCLAANARPEDEAIVARCLNAVGRAYRIPESQLDAVTGLSGSGPAFVYLMIEALSDGGVRSGLPRDIATVLAAQTVLGAARMVLETGLHPGVLKDQVTSPGGTTIAGLHAMERGGVRAALMDAVDAATRRSAELAGIAARNASI
ncbi:MAG: pyrroline-5-carboxylate reductase [Planctomycetota bacterium]|nr:pyrroline-5-carboxylate reductase [Planctomycetota bacterium]